MFKLNEIIFYEKYDTEKKELVSMTDSIGKEILFDHIFYVQLDCVNNKIIRLNQVFDFDFSKNIIKFKNELFNIDLYNYYINNSKVFKVHVIAMCVDCCQQDKEFYSELIFDSFFNCRIKELKMGLKFDSKMEVVIK